MSPSLWPFKILLYLTTHVWAEESLEARRTSLAQLPLEKLLQVKQTLGTKEIYEKGDPNLIERDHEDSPLPLRGGDWERRRRRKPNRRGDSWDEKEGKSKDISSIFQSTVTILSFLAFGGYLLCLIIQGVKGSTGTPGGVPMIPGGIVPTVPPAAFVGKRRKREIAESSMTETLERLAEAYARYSLSENGETDTG